MEGERKLSSRSQKFTKASRLKNKKDFRFARFKRIKTRYFVFVVSSEGRGRLGVSLSKKVLKTAVARNRVRRLLREAFRRNPGIFENRDINVLALDALSKYWKRLSYSEVEEEIFQVHNQLHGDIQNG